ncbi:MAG: response regulator [Oligoflexales bacterium]
MTEKLAGFITQRESNTRRILVVDDEVEILEIMEEFLLNSFPEAQIVTADDGQEALNLALKNQYDIICTDHRMPIMSGAEFVNKIRGDEHSINKNTPILFVTSFIDDARKSIKFKDNIFFLNKPFDSANLVLYVDSVMLRSALDVASQRKKLLELEKDFYEKQTRIIQRARVASYSEFSSGIAHELNNPLAVIEGLAYILEQDPSKAINYNANQQLKLLV